MAGTMDTGVTYDFLTAAESSLTGYNLLTLDVCRDLLKVVSKLLASRFEVHNVCAFRYLKVILISFTAMIHDTLDSPQAKGMVSLSREDRITRCTEAVELFRAIEPDTLIFTTAEKSTELNVLAKEVRKLIAKLLRTNSSASASASAK